MSWKHIYIEIVRTLKQCILENLNKMKVVYRHIIFLKSAKKFPLPCSILPSIILHQNSARNSQTKASEKNTKVHKPIVN